MDSIEGGLHGPPTDLEHLQDGDIRARIDFRAVFGEVAERWMGWDPGELFDATPEPVGFLSR